jgi:hypothetical protein
MKQFKKYLCLALLLSAPIVQADDCSDSSCSISSGSCNNGPKTIIVPLTQLGSNLYTQYHEIFNPEDDCSWEARLSATYRFAQTYKGCDSIAPLLFGSNTLAFKGSTIKSPDNATSIADTDALLADYFGMGKDTNTSVTFNPQIRNNIIDFQFSAGGEKLWFQVNVPLMHSRWKLNDCGKSGTAGTADLQKASTLTVTTATSNRTGLLSYATTVNTASSEDLLNDDLFDDGASSTDFPTGTSSTTNNGVYGGLINLGYMQTVSATAPTSLSGTSQAATGTITKPQVAALSFADAMAGKTFGAAQARLYNNITTLNSCDSEWKVADIQLQLGWDFYKKECHHFGAYVKAVVPTGTEIDKDYMKNTFTALIGNGKHFELGLGLSAHAQLWECDDKYLDIVFDAYATHLFKKSQFRTFDLADKPLTRYALLKQLGTNAAADKTLPTAIAQVSGKPAQNDDSYPFNGVLVPVSNIYNGCYDVSADIRGEGILELLYSACDWKMGLGYAFSGKSKEKICGGSCSTVATTLSNSYGLKGISAMNDIGIQSPATNADGAFAGTTTTYLSYNNDIDPASDMYTYDININGDDKEKNSADSLASSLINSVVSNRSGLMEGQILHRIYAHADYTWSENCWMPTIGILGSVSFTTCSYKTPKNWDLGARLGISF